MKKNSKKKLPRYWLGTRKPTTLGYLPNKGIGESLTTTNPGISIQPDILAMRLNLIPNAIAKASSSMQFPMLMLLGMKSVPPAALPTAGTAGSIIAASSAAPAGTGVALGLGGKQVASVSPEIAGTAQTKATLGTVGKVAGALGTAYGLYSVGSDIANAGSHRSLGEMRNTLTTNTYSTAGGNTYTEKTGLNSGAELAYENENRKAKQTGLTMDAMGLGASAGGLIGGPLGMGIGAGIGLLAGGIASLFGFGDNEDEIRAQLDTLADENTRLNRQSRSEAYDLDIKDLFYSGQTSAANGKMPGFNNGKANARVSNGEIIGNFEDGYFRVPGSKNNKDDVKTHLGKKDFVISNKHGLSDYAWLTGDISGALAALSYLQKTGLMNKYKNGKMPKYWNGKIGDYLLVGLPRLAEMALVGLNINTDETADVSTYDPYVDDSEGRKAVNVLASQKYDERPYLYDAFKLLNMANWAARTMPGIGLGGRALLLLKNFADYLSSLAKVHTTKNEMDIRNNQVYANALATLGAKNQQARIQSHIKKYDWLQQAYGARFGALRQDRAQLGSLIAAGAKDLYSVSKDRSANTYRDRMENMYDRQLSNDELKIQAEIANAAANRQLAAAMYGGNKVVPNIIQDPVLEDPYRRNYRIGQAFKRSLLNQTF